MKLTVSRIVFNRRLSLLLIIALLFSLFNFFSIGTTYATGDKHGAREVFVGNETTGKGELFLGGNYIELGISNWGDFGTEGGKPSNFNGTKHRNNIGMSVNHEGFQHGSMDNNMDYYLPGSPEERFAVGYQVGGSTYKNSNAALRNSRNMATTIERKSSGDELKARVVSTWANTMEIEQVISFKVDDKVFKNVVTITNLTSETWENARYMRSLDPDNTKDIGNSYVTSNTVTHTIEEDGIAVVKSESVEYPGQPSPLFFYSKDPAAKGSAFGFTNDDPYAYEAYDGAKPKGYNVRVDEAITMTWQSRELGAGEHQTFEYYTSLDDRDFDTILRELERDSGFKETADNDGTVGGKQRIVIKGRTLIDDAPIGGNIDLDKFTVNNMPKGLKLGKVTKLSNAIIEIEFDENEVADKHSSEYSLDNVSLTIIEDILTGVGDYTSERFPITFIDKAYAYISSSTVSEPSLGGHVAGEVIVKVVNGTLDDDIDLSEIMLNNVIPLGLTYTAERMSDTELKFSFGGNVDRSLGWEGLLNDLDVSIPADQIIGSDTPLTTNTFDIDLFHKDPASVTEDVYEKVPYLFIVNPVNRESIDDPGKFSETITIEIVNGEFDPSIDGVISVSNAVYGINLPSGLTESSSGLVIGNIEVVPGSGNKQINIQLVGTASGTDMFNAQFAIPSSYVIPNGDSVFLDDKVLSNTSSFLFRDLFKDLDPPKWIEILAPKPTDIYANPSGDSFLDPLKLKMHNGTFNTPIDLDEIAINNLPNGVEVDPALTKISPDGTELEIYFKIVDKDALDLISEPASEFASVTTSDATSEPFAFKPASEVTWDTIKKFNGNIEDASGKKIVTGDLNLVTIGPEHAPVTWVSTVPGVIHPTTGVVMRPGPDEADAPVTLTATYHIAGEAEPTEITFNVIVKKAPVRLQLVDVTIEDRAPNQATLKFNQDINSELNAEDFVGLTIDGQAVIDVSINGAEAIVTLEEPLAPSAIDADSPLVLYDESKGKINAAEDLGNFLSEISDSDNDTTNPDREITGALKNNIIPLELVTAFVEDGQLKLIFNKLINGDELDLAGMEYGGKPILEPYRVDGHEVTVQLPSDHTGDVLTYEPDPEPGNIKHIDNPNNTLGKIEPGIDLGTDQFYIKEKLQNDLGFTNQSSEIDLEPEFDANIPNGYTANVPYGIKSVNLDPIPESTAGTFVRVTVNGQEVDNLTDDIPLGVGVNIVKVGIFDELNPSNLLGEYQFVIKRNRKPATTETISVDVAIGGAAPKDIVTIPVEQTTDRGGKVTTKATYTIDKAQESVDKGKETGERIARIIIPDPEDIVSVTMANIPLETAKLLYNNNMDLEIYTENALVHVSNSSLQNIEEDFYFRLIPVRDANERSEVEERARTEKIVIEVAGNEDIDVVTRPMTIETNLSSRPVTLTLPLRDVALPSSVLERDRYLDELFIFIEHSDGEKSLIKGEPVTLENGEWGLQFMIQKFSTFTIIHMEVKPDGEHHAYVEGYPDGTFKPSRTVTRAEMATLLARSGAAGATTGLGFPDVSESHWAANFVKQAQASGLMQGYPDGEFKLDQGISRAELAAIAFNHLKLNELEENTFADVSAEHWASGIISALVKQGLMVGYPDGTFRPDQSVTRAEAVTIVNRLVERGPLYNMAQPSWPDVMMDHWAYRDIEEASQDHAYINRPEGGETVIKK